MARKIIEYTTRRKPSQATPWSGNTLARELGVSPSRGWRANGLKRRLTRTFKESHDRQFVEKPKEVTNRFEQP